MHLYEYIIAMLFGTIWLFGLGLYAFMTYEYYRYLFKRKR